MQERGFITKKKIQINGYKVLKSKSHQFIIVRKCQSHIMEKLKNGENPNIQGNAGKMH